MSDEKDYPGWTARQIARACLFIKVLANTRPDEWRKKEEIYEALREFRQNEVAE
jgi:hypothetical protein